MQSGLGDLDRAVEVLRAYAKMRPKGAAGLFVRDETTLEEFAIDERSGATVKLAPRKQRPSNPSV